jgi:molecular chaperone DnaK
MLSIGIDFGCTNTCAAVVLGTGKPGVIPTPDRQRLTPSVVVWDHSDGRILVGQAALNRAHAGSLNAIFSIKRLMGRRYSDPEVEKVRQHVSYRYTILRPDENRDQAYVQLGEKSYSPIEISALILAKIKADAEGALSQPVTHAVVTVPAYFDDSQREAMRQAGNMAGFQVLRVIDEPVAAAYAFGMTLDRDPAKTIIVYDLGGGTFDISIISISEGIPLVEHIEGDNWLGGDRFDGMIMDYVISQMERKQPGIGPELRADAEFLWRVRRAAEEAKKQLGASPTADIVLFGTLGGTVDVDVQVQRTDFESWIRGDIERSIALVDKAIEGPGLTPEDIDAVLLAGGSTRLPLVRRLLAEKFGEEKIKADVDPMLCNALGAAAVAARSAGVVCDDWLRKCPHCGALHRPWAEVCDQTGGPLGRG